MSKRGKLDGTMVINGFSVGAIVRMIEIIRLDVARTCAYPKEIRPYLLTTEAAKKSALMLDKIYPTDYGIWNCKKPADVDGILIVIEDFIASIATIR